MRLAGLRVDGFLLAILVAILLAALWPEFGAGGGPWRLERVATWAVSAVFFLHGAQLATESLARGARNWRLHLLVQLTTFVAFPLVGFLLCAALAPVLAAPLALGLYYLTALCSTISSSVTLVALAGGAVPAAVFNATLSSVMGVFLTPLLVGLVADTAGIRIPLGDAVAGVVVKVLVPLLAGQLARPLFGELLARHRRTTAYADRAVIVLIVYLAFADSIAAGVWGSISWLELAGVLAIAAALLGLATVAVLSVSRRLGFAREAEIVALFCGTQKSLVSGMPIAKLLFAGNPSLGLIVLPMLVYHQLQLIVGALLARRYIR